MLQPTRIHELNEKPVKPGSYVLYWMQQSARTRYNHALEFAIEQANRLDLPVLVCFGIMDDYPEANERHYAFMLAGLRDVEKNLKDRRIKFVARYGSPETAAIHFLKDAAMVVCDRGYLRFQKRWRDTVCDAADCRVVEVETDVVVPVDTVSQKHEFAARTIRPKLHKIWNDYLVSLKPRVPKHSSLRLAAEGQFDVSKPDEILKKLKLDRSVKPVDFYHGGEDNAAKVLADFTQSKLDGYHDHRNEPAGDRHSYMSMFLHFGQISPLELALHVQEQKKKPAADRDAYLEELIVRRELSMNFCHFEPKYDTFDCLPDWALKTLAKHEGDTREVTYTRKQLEDGKTADRYWNAAQMQMVICGFMHNYMRMYWGKKILEWSDTPQEAFHRVAYLNNKYELDGRDANSWANIAWIFGLHDRPWGERKIFGTVRYMNAGGLERKFEIGKYVEQIDTLCRKHLGHPLSTGKD